MQELTTEVGSTFKCKSSSVLNRAADFVASNMFVDDDSCWNSDGGGDGGQWLLFDFLGKTVEVKRVRIMFQGGFVGQDGVIEMKGSKNGEAETTIVMDEIKRIEDSNDVQQWDIPAASSPCKGKFAKILFPTSTDFYGRVTIYKLSLWGQYLD
jgi:hypothetical protein